jgi:hypothetical protein
VLRGRLAACCSSAQRPRLHKCGWRRVVGSGERKLDHGLHVPESCHVGRRPHCARERPERGRLAEHRLWYHLGLAVRADHLSRFVRERHACACWRQPGRLHLDEAALRAWLVPAQRRALLHALPGGVLRGGRRRRGRLHAMPSRHLDNRLGNGQLFYCRVRPMRARVRRRHHEPGHVIGCRLRRLRRWLVGGIWLSKLRGLRGRHFLNVWQWRQSRHYGGLHSLCRRYLLGDGRRLVHSVPRRHLNN